MTGVIQIANFLVTASAWTTLAFRYPGSCLKSWFVFDADLHLRSDPNDATTDYLLAVAKGNEFEIPYVGPISLDDGRVLVYVQAASGTVNVTLFYVMQ
jgi:hypothetical protein